MDSNEEKQTKKLKYPKWVAFIVANEFCERFSYYGMKTILPLFLTSKLGYTNDTTMVIYHTFIMFVYLPTAGSNHRRFMAWKIQNYRLFKYNLRNGTTYNLYVGQSIIYAMAKYYKHTVVSDEASDNCEDEDAKCDTRLLQ